MERKYRILFFILLLVWFLVNLGQAVWTEVLSDEAYYGLYGKFLAWGYFDHPPMVGLMTFLSSIIFNNNLGIRFLTVILEPLTLVLIWKIIDERDPDSGKVYSFFIIAGSICLFAAYGFFATPDAPLLFFTALFLLSYKKFLAKQSAGSILLLAVSMAGLVYSKYQAVLVIGLVVISNLKLLKSRKFWLAGLMAVVLFSPHIYWQISNGYPSVKFHLIERSEGFRWHHLLEYIPNQMAVFNPIVLGASVYIMIKNKINDQFTRALYFLITGFLGFFALTAIRGHVEPHWTIACSVAMIILIYNNSNLNRAMFRFVRRAMLPVVIILLIFRVLLLFDFKLGRYFGFSGKRVQSEFIESVARDLPVLFPGSFQKPSLYAFFTGRDVICVSSLYSRKTEFDIWQFEKQFNNKPVFIYSNVGGRSKLYRRGDLEFYGYVTDSLQTVNRIGIELKSQLKMVSSGDSVQFSVKFTNSYPFDVNFNHRQFPVSVCMAFIKGEEINLFPVILKEPVTIMHNGEKITKTICATIPDLPAGTYNFGICLRTILGPAINDSFSKIRIGKR
jgi:hypothetical protein